MLQQSDQWVAYATMENELSEMGRLERLFHASLMDNYSIALWSIYLGHVQRQHNLTMQPEKRPIVSQAWEFTLGQIGMDKDAGQLWQDYISFIKSAPGTIGGSGWQDAQKMDTLRKAYQRAFSVPTQATTSLWKEYDNFEMGLNKMTGRKFLQEKSPSYMTARSSYTALQNITRDLDRTTLPSLPPVPGCGGEDEYLKQVEIWQKWIEWEKEDPLVLKDEDLAAYRNRVLFVYRQAVVSLRFWPQMWYDAADWCFENDLEKEGNEFLTKGVAANPESCLLAFRQADRIEQTMVSEEGAEGAKKKGDAVKAPYDNLLTALYALIDKVKQREAPAIARIQEYFASLPPLSREPTPQPEDDDDEDEKTSEGPALNSREAEQNRQIEEVRKSTQVQIETLKKTLSFAWIALLRAMRRIQGKGKPEVDGMRNVFATARKKGRLTSDVYVATALLEHHCYKDPAATKIFERGMKLFPEDEHFALAYLKHLIDINDVTSKSIHYLDPRSHTDISHRRSRCLRDNRLQAHHQARKHPPHTNPLPLLPRIRIPIRRARPNHQARAPNGRALPLRSLPRPFRPPLRRPSLRPLRHPPRPLAHPDPSADRHRDNPADHGNPAPATERAANGLRALAQAAARHGLGRRRPSAQVHPRREPAQGCCGPQTAAEEDGC